MSKFHALFKIKLSFRNLAEMYPGNCASFWKFSDELYLILDFILQKHFLKFHNSLFAENFYGLDRKLKNTNSVTLTLLCNVLLPYLKLKCDRLFEKFGNEILDSKLKKCFVAVYPYLHMTWEGSTTLFVILYCIGKSRHHSPFVFLSRSVVGHSVNDVSTYDAVKSFGEKVFFWTLTNILFAMFFVVLGCN